MYRIAHMSFQGQVMGPSLRPNFQPFLTSSSSSGTAPAPLCEAVMTACTHGHEAWQRERGHHTRGGIHTHTVQHAHTDTHIQGCMYDTDLHMRTLCHECVWGGSR